MFCEECGKKLEQVTKFCPHCGHESILEEKSKVSGSSRFSKKWWIIGGIIILLLVGVFAVPIPYTAIEVHTVQEPYTVTETYMDTEPYVGTEYYDEPTLMTVEECKSDISLNPSDYIGRGINALLTGGDLSSLLETCQEVARYRTITKSRQVVNYRTVEKERQVTKYREVKQEIPVTKKATLFMMMTWQVDYYYEV